MRRKLTVMVCCLTLLCGTAMAQEQTQQAAPWNAELTPLGGERNGNADGSIPPWDPNTPVPAEFVAGSGSYPDPYAGDGILYSIDQTNWQQYSEWLTEGTQQLFRQMGKYGFKVHVYPSRRHYESPRWYYTNTAKNHARAKLVDDGLRVQNSLPGTPFPVPSSGIQVLWNHLVRYGTPLNYRYDVYYVGADGNAVLSTTATANVLYPVFDNPDEEVGDSTGAKMRIDYLAPSRRAGEKLLVHEPGANFSKNKGRKAWQYLTGQRRVRRAPAVAFDTPNPAVAGTSTYDDAMIYNGSPERYHWKLIGVREMLIPYNNYDFLFKYPVQELLGEHFINPQYVRWEKHRVWVIEGDLKEGVRHLYSKRRLYIDEDSWAALASDAYDGQGNLWRSQYSYSAKLYDNKTMFSAASGAYDFAQGIYNLNGKPIPGKFKLGVNKSSKYFMAKSLARGSVR